MKYALITGGCGYIGSHVTLALKNQNYNLIIVDDLSTGDVNNLVSDVIFEQGNIGDQTFLNNLFARYDFDVIIHLAAKTDVAESLANPFLYYQENTFNTALLIETAAKHNVKQFIFSSTAAIYKSDSDHWIDEQRTIAPINPYGRSKFFAEQIIQDIAEKNNMNCIILRYFNAAGVDASLQIGNRKKIITTLIQKLAKNIAEGNNCIEIFGNDYPTKDNTCIRDYIHVRDIANAHVLALKNLSSQKITGCEIFNVGYGIGLSVLDVIDLFERVSDIKIQRILKKRRPGDPVISIANPEKIKTVLGWQPVYADNFAEIIRSELLWWKKLV